VCRGLAVLLAATGAHAADLSAVETRWLQGMRPVLNYARSSGVALDIVAQPQPSAGAAPLAMAFVDGRCKLVLSMRGNPEAQATLDRIEPDLLDATLELMAAHELGHCRRYLDGSWYALPAGFVAGVPAAIGPELQEAWQAMQATRREEAYGDLVGLAWTQRRHPHLYARLHAWLVAERSRELVPRSHHDTLAWVRKAASGVVRDETSMFTAAASVWQAGLAAAD
jgi:hypothetical protein